MEAWARRWSGASESLIGMDKGKTDGGVSRKMKNEGGKQNTHTEGRTGRLVRWGETQRGV